MLNRSKFIGSGLQYRVYRVGPQRVMKIPTTRRQKIIWLKAHGITNKMNIKKLVDSAEKITKASVYGLQKRIPLVNLKSLGQPRFLSKLRYEQNFATPLERYFATHTLRDNKKIIEAYADHVINTWRRGFSDTVFNFTINYGVRNGLLILFDLGELSFSKQKIQNLVIKKKWLTQWSYITLKDKKLKKFFFGVMNKRIHRKSLESSWGIYRINNK